MKKRKLTVLMIMAIISVLCFAACGSKETMTLEKYCQENPDVQESIDSAMADSNVVVEIKGNEIIYSFDLSTQEGFTEEIAKDESIIKAIDEALTAAAPTFGDISKSIEDSTEIQGISTTVNYTWGDEVLVTKTFTSADSAATTETDPAEAAEDVVDEAQESEGE